MKPDLAYRGIGRVVQGGGDARGLSLALCASRFHEPLVERLVEGAGRALAELGAAPEQVDLLWVPGAFELPLGAQTLARSGKYDAIVALGVVIRGETPHFEYVCAESARGIAEVSRQEGIPVLFGVVTAGDALQAHARCGGTSNKGEDAARAAVSMVSALRQLREGR